LKNVKEVRSAKGLGSHLDAIVKLTFDTEGVDVAASLESSDSSNQLRVISNVDTIDTQNLLSVEKSISFKLMNVQEKSDSKGK
jgi:hypothetical protein